LANTLASSCDEHRFIFEFHKRFSIELSQLRKPLAVYRILATEFTTEGFFCKFAMLCATIKRNAGSSLSESFQIKASDPNAMEIWRNTTNEVKDQGLVESFSRIT
jgi:hypothetical protein